MSDNEINGLSFAYTIWYTYLELGFIESNAESYGTNVEYNRDTCSTKSSAAVAIFLK